MRFLLLCICVGYSIGAHIPKYEITLDKSDPQQQEQFEVISLDSQSSQEPLLIRSRIPESLRLKGGDLTNGGGNILAPQTIQQIEGRIVNSLESFLADSQFFSHLSLPLSGSNQQVALASQDTGLNQPPTVNIESTANFTSLLDYESSFGAGMMSVDSETSQTPETKFLIPQVQPSSFNLVPAQLQYSLVGSSDITNNNEQKDSSSSKSVENALSGTTEKPGYTIEQVPEVASYSKEGPLSPSDIPSFSQIEAIFNISSVNKTVQDHSSDDYSELIESRSDIAENNVKDEVIISSTEDLDAITSDSLLENITSEVSKESSVSNITTNDIDDDNNDEAKDVVTDPQPLSVARDLDLINTIEDTEEITDSPILSLFDVNAVVNDDVNITNDESTTVLDSTITEENSLPEITTLDTSYLNVYLSDINEDNTNLLSNGINTSNFTGTEILSRSGAEEIVEDATKTDLTTELDNATETTTLEITTLSDIEDSSESTTTLYQETLIP